MSDISLHYQGLDYYRLDDLLTEDERIVWDLARDILAAAGITYEFQSGRHMISLESVSTYE